MDAIDALVNDLPDEIVDFIGDLQDSVETLTKSLADAEALAEATPSDPVVDDRDPIEKAFDDLDEDSAAVLREKLDTLDALEEKVTKSEQDSADAVYIEKARAFDGLGDPDLIGPALRRVADANPEDADLFEKAFAAASVQETTATLYEELGHAITKSTDVDGQVAEIAKSYREADPTLSEEESRSMVWENNPDLYEEHSQDQRARQRL